jgi:hypothetical protein
MANVNFSTSSADSADIGGTPWLYDFISCHIWYVRLGRTQNRDRDYANLKNTPISYHPYQETLRSGSDRFWMTECGHFLCDRHEHEPGICTHCKSTPISTYKITPNMDPKLLTWFQSPLLSLMTASRTINFQQAEISRLVAHLREQISKQNKALKKAAQQIRENSKTVTELEAARGEVIRLKRELASLSDGAGQPAGGTFKSPVVMRPIPRQHSSSDGGRQFLITGNLPESHGMNRNMGNVQPTNDGFGTEHPIQQRTTSAVQHQADGPSRGAQDPFLHPSSDPRIRGRPMVNDGSAVIVSDRTKGMGTFKHPDMLGISPRKRARTDDGREYVFSFLKSSEANILSGNPLHRTWIKGSFTLTISRVEQLLLECHSIQHPVRFCATPSLKIKYNPQTRI